MVTVLFVDMVGFTGVAGRLDPEDVRALQTRYFRTVAEAIQRWGGVVEKYVGDAVMAVFGVPVSDGYDAYRAVRAGMRLPEAAGRLTLPDGRPVRVRVGIATGEAVVDLAATVTGGQRLVSGDVVNMAARLQAAAVPGTVAVTAGTARATRALQRYERLAPATVAGRAQPLEICRPLAASPGTDPAEDTPLVGRAAELATAAGHIARGLRERVPRLISVAGAAGTGKSRLVRELSRYPGIGPADGVDWRFGRCLPDGSPDGSLSGLMGEGLSAPRRPTVLVVEDGHWVGARVARLLRELLAAAATRRCPLAVILASRSGAGSAGLRDGAGPGPVGVAGLVPDCRIVLGPLTQAQTDRLLRYLLPRAGRPAALARRLLPLVQGNPMYAEAYAETVAERGARSADTPPVPEPVRAAVAARLDRLTPADRRAVLAAAVLGPTVPAVALALLLRLSADEVHATLSRLVRAGLLAESSGRTGHGYGFVDPAVRAVAYARLTRRDRVEYHRRAAEWFDARPDASHPALAGPRVRHWLAVLGLCRALRQDDTPYRPAAWRAIADATGRPCVPAGMRRRSGSGRSAAAHRGTAPRRRAGPLWQDGFRRSAAARGAVASRGPAGSTRPAISVRPAELRGPAGLRGPAVSRRWAVSRRSAATRGLAPGGPAPGGLVSCGRPAGAGAARGGRRGPAPIGHGAIPTRRRRPARAARPPPVSDAVDGAQFPSDVG